MGRIKRLWAVRNIGTSRAKAGVTNADKRHAPLQRAQATANCVAHAAADCMDLIKLTAAIICVHAGGTHLIEGAMLLGIEVRGVPEVVCPCGRQAAHRSGWSATPEMGAGSGVCCMLSLGIQRWSCCVRRGLAAGCVWRLAAATVAGAPNRSCCCWCSHVGKHSNMKSCHKMQG